MPVDTSPTGPITPKKPLEPEKPVSQPPSSFESYMQDAGGQSRVGQPGTTPAQGAPGPSEVRPPTVPQAGAPTFDSLLGQARNVQDGLGTVQQQLKSPNMKLKRSQAHLVKHKLQDTNTHLRAAADKLGVETPAQQSAAGASPIGRFLAYIGDGQDIISSVQLKLSDLSKSNEPINPATMLFAQIKLGQAQQELEYSTTLLGKVMDSIKTIMNTQL